ncbi:MAG TPA: hypothetical protein VGG16_26660 [Streptosporangiaceae bacterium]
MPIPLPDLDDRSFAELTAEAATLIPGLDPAWTNYNPSDPGITLVELLAWLTEMLLYQVNQIPPASTEKFLELLNGHDWVRPPGVSLDAAIRQTIRDLRDRYRAVTAEDYEWLALHAWPSTEEARRLPGGGKLIRASCIPGRDLAAPDPKDRRADAPAHVSLVVIPAPGIAADEDVLYDALWRFFDERRTLTTRQHVVGPRYVPIQISANLALHDGAEPLKALAAARQDLMTYYDPLTGGPNRKGWPLGRAVYPSEAAAVLERAWLVDYVEDVTVTRTVPAERTAAADGAVVLDADELVRLVSTGLVGYDVHGRRHVEP